MFHGEFGVGMDIHIQMAKRNFNINVDEVKVL